MLAAGETKRDEPRDGGVDEGGRIGARFLEQGEDFAVDRVGSGKVESDKDGRLGHPERFGDPVESRAFGANPIKFPRVAFEGAVFVRTMAIDPH